MLKVTFPSNKLQELIPCINVRDFMNEKNLLLQKIKNSQSKKPTITILQILHNRDILACDRKEWKEFPFC